MHVLFKRHLLVTGVLAGVVVILLAVLVMMSLHLGPFREETLEVTPNYINDEEAVVILPADDEGETIILPVAKVLFEYVEVIDGCGVHFEGECVNVRSGPGTDYPVVSRLRNSVVLKVAGKVERDGRTWYKIAFTEWIRYPERVRSDWYVAADFVNALLDEGDRNRPDDTYSSSTKRIIVERGKQMLTAYDGEELFMEERISTGRELTPTPRGKFTIFKKTPSRYMQGPIPGITAAYYDLPGVPWNLYFTNEGAVIHGAYWHNSFGRPYSNGCVNLSPESAKKLYLWADVGTQVIVRD